MLASSETAWPSVMVKSGASALGGADGHGNCGHMMFHFQFQAYTELLLGNSPATRLQFGMALGKLDFP